MVHELINESYSHKPLAKCSLIDITTMLIKSHGSELITNPIDECDMNIIF